MRGVGHDIDYLDYVGGHDQVHYEALTKIILSNSFTSS